MKIVKDMALIVVMVLVVILLVPAALALSAYIGYFFGIILAWLASYVLATSGVTFELIPTITAWLFVASAIIGYGGKTVKAGDDE